MQTEFMPDRVRTTIAAADAVARRLEWRLRLPKGEWEDIRQDLLSDFLRRLPAYDHERGSLQAFAQVVFTHRAARIARRIGTERRTRGALLSLELPLDDDPRPLREGVGEDARLWFSGEPAETTAERRHDVDRVLQLLAAPDRELCTGLAVYTASALARAGFGSRSQLYRRVADLRCVLTAHGLGPAWDDLEVA